MFVDLTDYTGQPARVDAARLVKLRPASARLGDPMHSVLVDFGTGALFARGTLDEIATLFRPHIRLAGLHAPDTTPTLLNVDAIAALEVDRKYAGECVAVVKPGFENPRVSARNKIPLAETVAQAQAALDSA